MLSLNLPFRLKFHRDIEHNVGGFSRLACQVTVPLSRLKELSEIYARNVLLHAQDFQKFPRENVKY